MYTVLIVDDIPQNIQLLATLLSNEYRISIAESGTRALESIAISKPDLILLDIMLPDIDGYSICKKLKEAPSTREIPIIFLTAKTETEDVVKGFELGGADYVLKPFKFEELNARIKTHIALQESKKALQKLNKTKDRFFSIIAHDLKNPIAGQISLTEALLKKIDNLERTDFKRYIEMLHRSSGQNYRLLENLLEWARAQSGEIQFYPENVELKKLFKKIKDEIGSFASSKEIQIEFTDPIDLRIVVDKNMLLLILRNLIVNAIKFSYRNGLVFLGLKEDSSEFLFYIQDRGVGMSAEIINKLFKLGESVKQHGTERESGSGLGLILCAEFVNRHGGKIWVESEENKGSTFYFTIPKNISL
ncbi:MAG: hybrid sensor histidine kinase/response regulator [Leptospiraceae bacterium]|nr:hybrid sensor histidine kinase/response regulator [Leptospiraceae bacterium]